MLWQMELAELQHGRPNLSTPRAHATNGKGDGRSLLSPCCPTFSAPRECCMLLGPSSKPLSSEFPIGPGSNFPAFGRSAV